MLSLPNSNPMQKSDLITIFLLLHSLLHCTALQLFAFAALCHLSLSLSTKSSREQFKHIFSIYKLSFNINYGYIT